MPPWMSLSLGLVLIFMAHTLLLSVRELVKRNFILTLVCPLWLLPPLSLKLTIWTIKILLQQPLHLPFVMESQQLDEVEQEEPSRVEGEFPPISRDVSLSTPGDRRLRSPCQPHVNQPPEVQVISSIPFLLLILIIMIKSRCSYGPL